MTNLLTPLPPGPVRTRPPTTTLIGMNEESLHDLIDLAAYATVVATPALRTCGQHPEQEDLALRFRDHAVTCMGMEAAPLDRFRLQIGSSVDDLLALPGIHVGPTPPENPVKGDLWFDTSRQSPSS